jgi:hypothetical protein
MVTWYLNRLRLMSFPELGLRFYRKVRQKVWKILLPFVSGRLSRREKEGAGLPGDWLSQLTRLFPLGHEPDLGERYGRYFPREAVIENGKRLVRGKLPIFEGIYDTRGMMPDWHQDGLGSPPWPKVFSGDLNHNDLRYGRIINVWELNRHFHFYDLGKAYRLTGDKRYALTLIAHLDSWIDQNPPGKGINWFSPMECGLRLINWLWGLFFIFSNEGPLSDPSPLVSVEQGQRILTSIYWQAYSIEKNLSKFSSANNHVIGEALGLFWVGSLIPSLPRAEKWKKKGWAILCREIEKQVFPDGVPCEQSHRYLFFLFDLYTLAILLAQKQNQSIPGTLWGRLERICEYIRAQMDEGGHLPDRGDSSDGMACKLHTSSEFNPYRSLLITGALWFGRGDFKSGGGAFDERNFWLFGEAGLKSYGDLEADLLELPSRLFPQGGQVVLRKGRGRSEEVLTMDAGPFGYLSIAAHAHADALSFTLSIGGRPVIIDPGTYLYHDGGRWRDYFRGTRAHNTIEVDGQDQAVSGGPFMWLSKPEASIAETVFDRDRDYVRAMHNGYHRLIDPVQHERSILFDKNEGIWLLDDRLVCAKSHRIRQTFHFHPDCRIEMVDEGVIQVSREEPLLYLKPDPTLTIFGARGSEDPPFGWFSPAFGQKKPIQSLMGEKQIRETVRLQTWLWRPAAFEKALKRIAEGCPGN